MTLRGILLVSGAIVVAVLVVVALLLRHYTSSRYVVRSLEEKLGPDYRVAIESSHYDLFSQTFYASGVAVVEDTLSHGPKPDGGRRRSWSSYELPAVAVRGVNLWELKRGSIIADEFRFERPVVKVFLDRKTPSKHPGPRRMPHEVLMASDSRVRIGTVKIIRGDIEYGEQSLTGVRPGTFRFGDFYLTMRNFGNDRARMPSPCVIDVRTRLANSGLMNATFNYDLSSDVTKLNYHAVMGKMDARGLNSLLMNIKGIRIEEGTIDSLRADIRVHGDNATGTVWIPYHKLKFTVLDKATYKQDMNDKFATFMSARTTRDSNPEDDGDPVTMVQVQRRRAPNVSLMKFVWETVRQGALMAVGAPEPPG